MDTAHIQQVVFDYGMKLLGAVVIFIVGKWGASIVAKIIDASMTKAKINLTLVSFTRALAYFGVLIFVCIAALSQLGVQTTSFVALIGAAGLAVGLAFQGTLSNFASGVLLIIFHPFKCGDQIEAAGSTGIVTEIQIFNTVLNTDTGKIVIIPNSKITSDKITIHTVAKA